MCETSGVIASSYFLAIQKQSIMLLDSANRYFLNIIWMYYHNQKHTGL